MKKIIFTILLLGIIVLNLTGCGSSNTFTIGDVSDMEISNNSDVSLSVKDGTLKNTSVTLILANDSDKLLRYDDVYEIEIKKDNEWHKINVELYFDMPLWEVKENSKEEIELNWEHEYGKLAKGNYRIIKEVYFEVDDNQEESFYVSAEFTIE